MNEKLAEASVFNRRRYYLLLLLIFSSLLTLVAVLLPMLSASLTPVLAEGQIASRDFRAPHSISYTSEIRTEQRRRTAEQSVSPIYTSPDTRVARRQMELLRAALAYIGSVRADAYATPDQKVQDLSALEEVHLSADAAKTVLQVNDARYQAIQQEALSVLERTMSTGIRPETISDAMARVPALVSLSFPEDQALVVAELTSAFVAANSQYSEELTQSARQKARASVEPVTRTFILGQTIVLQGEVIDAEDVEALQKLDLAQQQTDWTELAGSGGITILMIALIVFYLRRKHSFAHQVRRAAATALLGLAFLLVGRLVLPAHIVVPYAFPLSAFGLTVAALFGTEPAIVLSLALSILTAYALPNSLELTLYYIVTSLFSILALGRARRLWSFASAGLAVGVSGSIIILIYRLPGQSTDLVGIATLVIAAFFNGLASASLTIMLHSTLANFLGSISSLQLIDLTRPDHPLLRLLLREAPGTYQHSLQVANLAEQAAERIGAEALLTRVGALYHDIGKTINPIYFIENQPPGFLNPHDDLSPADSAAIIIQHVKDGLDLGRKNKLPKRVLDFITEHHGTGLTRYQYYNALQAVSGDEGRLDQAKFRYPGPRPQSRETAILMLADGSEARVRAERPTDDLKLLALIKGVISDRIASGELDEARLTLHDLNLIAESFAATLRGVYHPRLQYPRLQQAASQETITLPLPRKTEVGVEERR